MHVCLIANGSWGPLIVALIMLLCHGLFFRTDYLVPDLVSMDTRCREAIKANQNVVSSISGMLDGCGWASSSTVIGDKAHTRLTSPCDLETGVMVLLAIAQW